MPSFEQIITFGIAIIFTGLISFLITSILIKINRHLIYALPILFAVIAAIFWILGLIANDWSALAFLLYGSFALIATIGSTISSFIIFFIQKKKSNPS